MADRNLDAVRGYRWGALFFALVVACSLAALPFAISCCSQFPAETLAEKAAFRGNGWAPGITPLSNALLDWPMGFRLLVLTLVASLVCLLATIAMLLITGRKVSDGGPTRAVHIGAVVAQAVLSSFIVGVLYILAVYVTGFVGYLGPANLIWMLGIPMLIALMWRPRLSGLALGLPLAIGGWICLGIISMSVGIPLD